MCAFVVLGLVLSYQANRLALEHLRNDLFCGNYNPINQQDMRWLSCRQNCCLVWIILADELLK